MGQDHFWASDLFYAHHQRKKFSMCTVWNILDQFRNYTHSPQYVSWYLHTNSILIQFVVMKIYTSFNIWSGRHANNAIYCKSVKPDFQSVLFKSSESATIISIQPNDIYVKVPVLVRHRSTELCNIWLSRTFFLLCYRCTNSHTFLAGIWKLFQGDGWFFSWMSINFTYLKFLNHVYTTNPPNICL